MAELILNTAINTEQEIILFPKTVDDFVIIKRKVKVLSFFTFFKTFVY